MCEVPKPFGIWKFGTLVDVPKFQWLWNNKTNTTKKEQQVLFAVDFLLIALNAILGGNDELNDISQRQIPFIYTHPIGYLCNQFLQLEIVYVAVC